MRLGTSLPLSLLVLNTKRCMKYEVKDKFLFMQICTFVRIPLTFPSLLMPSFLTKLRSELRALLACHSLTSFILCLSDEKWLFLVFHRYYFKSAKAENFLVVRAE